MRFIGRPNGKLMKGSPDNYNMNEIYLVPYKYKSMAYWELVDPPPVLRVPAARVEDSVFENQVFVPPDLDDLMKDAQVEILNGQTAVLKANLESIEEQLKEIPKSEPPILSGQPSNEPSANLMVPLVESVSEGSVKGGFTDIRYGVGFPVFHFKNESNSEDNEQIKEPVNEGGAKEPINNPVSALIDSVKAKKVQGSGDGGYLRPLDIGGGFIPIPVKKEEPFKEEPIKPEDDMPPELAYELNNIGDGIIGEGGEVKIERKKKTKTN